MFHPSGDPSAPLYDPAFEHDACGVGFVADAGRTSRDRVLPLALAGLAALGHRGAFAADGASSDGAGVSLPLERSLLERIGPGLARRRPGIVVLFLPRARSRRSAVRHLVADALAAESLTVAAWRTVPVNPGALGALAETSRPAIVQAIVDRPKGLTSDAFERRLVLARRRMEGAARTEWSGFAVASASCRTIVYKGLVAGDRLADFYPDLRPGLVLSYAIFHQRYATNTHPNWRLAQPFRLLAHNGEINTVRSNREQVRGRSADPAPGRFPRRLLASGPLLSPDGSDSLSLDEAVELLVLTGWRLDTALLGLIPEAMALRSGDGRAEAPVGAFGARTAPFLAPWDGPAAIVFGDGRRVGALVDRNGLRPAAYAVTTDGIVAVASEAGAIPIVPAETIRRGRLGPGDMLLVEPGRSRWWEGGAAKAESLRGLARDDGQVRHHAPIAQESTARPTPIAIRVAAGLDAERARLDIRTMALDGQEPLWSMGDDTPTPALARIDRPVTDHLRQSFAQVTNPPIDPDRERAVLDLSVELGRRPPLLGGPPSVRRTVHLDRPLVAEAAGILATIGSGRVRQLDATWDARSGAGGLACALERLANDARRAAASGRTELLVISDRSMDLDRLPVPTVLAVGTVHTALTTAGLRGRADILAESADVLDVHTAAMALAAGATVICPWLAVELASELAGGRGAEGLTAADTIRNLLAALEGGLRKTLARMGISTIASYIGGNLVESIELAPDVLARCLPAAPAWPGTVGLTDIAERQLRRRDRARGLAAAGDGARLADPGLARFRGDGELHLYAPAIVNEIQALGRNGTDLSAALDRYRTALARPAATVRDELRVRPAQPVPLAAVEPVEAIARRFVASAMSVGALSPEAHRAVTIGMQRAGGAANTGEGGEDPAWYVPGPNGERLDAKIKQVASARFGVTAAYLARADQLEIKMAQGSKPGEGGHLPGRKATAYIASLRRAQPGKSLISPPPHHDIYSIEDLAQLVADLRAINPTARIGVKLVATRGVGTIAAGVAKAGADYIHLAGHAGGTGASPLSSIKHAGAPWELGLAEVHQTLLVNGLRDRIALRTDGGLQTGRDLLVAALLGAEEFGFGTAVLVALGCDMARQCHLDTCPTGIATQRDDLRAKFAGSPDQVEHFVRALAADLRRELAAIGARSVGEIVGMVAAHLVPVRGRRTLDLRPMICAPTWLAGPERRERPDLAGRSVARAPASPLEHGIVVGLTAGQPAPTGDLEITTAERSFGAELAGAAARGAIPRTVRLSLRGAAGQSFGAFLPAGIELRLQGQANDGVAKGLSGGTVIVGPEADLAARPESAAIAGNACLYGATAGQLHLVGRAGMRFAVRNSGAEAVVEGVGAHGCEYMTGGVVLVVGPIGPNFGAGMTGGRAYVLDPTGRAVAALHAPSVTAERLVGVLGERLDGPLLVAEVARLLRAHRAVGSAVAARLLADGGLPLADLWLVEPAAPPTPALPTVVPASPDARESRPGARPIPVRNHPVPGPMPTTAGAGRTLD